MAKRKRKSRRQSFVSKVLNGLGIAIGLSRIIEIVFRNIGNPANILPRIMSGATFGLSEGSLDTTEGARFYAPVGAAVGYGYLKSYLVKKFPIRR